MTAMSCQGGRGCREKGGKGRGKDAPCFLNCVILGAAWGTGDCCQTPEAAGTRKDVSLAQGGLRARSLQSLKSPNSVFKHFEPAASWITQ